MKKKWQYVLLTFLVCGLISCENEEKQTEEIPQKTIFVYLVADNDISGELYNNINALEEGLSKVSESGTNLIIYWDGSASSELINPTLFTYEKDKKGNLSEKIILKTYEEQNSVDKNVMSAVFADMRRFSQDGQYGLIFGSHASGWLPSTQSRSFGKDNGMEINVTDLAEVLQNSNLYFDFILFDACLMSTVEVAYEFRNTSEYLLMSPAEVLSHGFPYEEIMVSLFKKNSIEENLTKATKTFIEYYAGTWGTIALIKCEQMDALAAETKQIFTEYKESIPLISLDGIQQYGRGVYNKSIYDFREVVKLIANGDVSEAFDAQLNKVIVYKDCIEGSYLSPLNIEKTKYSGIGCYLPFSSMNSGWNVYYKSMDWYAAGGLDQVDW